MAAGKDRQRWPAEHGCHQRKMTNETFILNTHIMKQQRKQYVKPATEVFHVQVENGYQVSGRDEEHTTPTVDRGNIEGIVDGGTVYF